MPEPICPKCGEPLGAGIDEGECGRCGAYIVRHRQTGEPVVVEKSASPRPSLWSRIPISGAVCAGCALLAVIGAALPWVDAGIISMAGTRGDGLLVLAAGAIGLLGLVSYRRRIAFTVLEFFLAAFVIIVAVNTYSNLEGEMVGAGIWVVIMAGAIWIVAALSRLVEK